MGRDKALIEIAGVPLLQQICQAALQCASPVYVVTAWGDRYRSFLPPACVLVPETNAQGPLIGFAHGLIQVQTEWVLLLACDLPRLQGEPLQQWAKELSKVPQDTIALLPKSQKGWEPLCGFYRRDCITTLQNFVDCGGRSFQKWLAEQSVQELRLANHHLLFNCNTQTDLENV